MNTIFDELSYFYGWKPQAGSLAVEIETEVSSVDDYLMNNFPISEKTNGNWNIPLKTWDGHKDGSLRNFGLEFVSKKPLPFTGMIASLKEFRDKTALVPFIKDAPATSVHVHLNATQLSMTGLGNFLTTWMLFENLLIEFSGESRRSNLFALPNRCAEGCCKNIVSMFSQLESGHPTGLKWHQEVVKYAAINIGRLSSLGSLEVRCFRGTTNTEEISEWVTILNDLFVFAQTEGMNPRHILMRYRNDPIDFIREVFRNSWVYLKRVADTVDVIKYSDRNIWYAAMIADSVVSWDKLNTLFSRKRAETKNKKPKPKPAPSQFINLDGEVDWGAFNHANNEWAHEQQLINSQNTITEFGGGLSMNVIHDEVVDDIPMVDEEIFSFDDDED